MQHQPHQHQQQQHQLQLPPPPPPPSNINNKNNNNNNIYNQKCAIDRSSVVGKDCQQQLSAGYMKQQTLPPSLPPTPTPPPPPPPPFPYTMDALLN